MSARIDVERPQWMRVRCGTGCEAVPSGTSDCPLMTGQIDRETFLSNQLSMVGGMWGGAQTGSQHVPRYLFSISAVDVDGLRCGATLRRTRPDYSGTR